MRPLFPLVRQQVKAVELGNWFATRGYQKTQAGVLHRPDELIVLVLSYNTNALSIVLCTCLAPSGGFAAHVGGVFFLRAQKN